MMKTLCTLPNILSALRIPLAFCLFVPNPYFRLGVFIAAMLTDILDGYFARRRIKISTLGTYLDPITDKFFVYMAVAIFFAENKMNLLQIIAFLCRDFSLIAFAVVLWCFGGWQRFSIRSFYCGKITTSLQFIFLMVLALDIHILPFFYVIIAALGILSFFELLWIYSWQKE